MQQVLDRLADAYPGLSTQLKQAAKFVLDQPNEVAINSMRRLAAQADVAPSTMLRLAKALDFASYEAFRQPFRDAARGRPQNFGERARGLQATAGDDAQLLARMARANQANLDAVFHDNDVTEFINAARLIRDAEKVYIIGTGGAHAWARYFHYVGRMTLSRLRLPAGHSGSLLDDLVDITARDAALVVTVEPYTTVTVDAARFIAEKGAKTIAITDSRAAPITAAADALLLATTESPQFFPSYTAVTALIETLLALIVSGASADSVRTIAEMEKLRRDSGIYWSADKS